jgi:hypothetical protein
MTAFTVADVGTPVKVHEKPAALAEVEFHWLLPYRSRACEWRKK